MSKKKFLQKWLPKEERLKKEEVALLLRRHPVTLLFRYIILLFVGLMPVIVYWIIETNFPPSFSSNISQTLGIMFASLYYIFLIVIAYSVFIDYYLDVWIVTTHRVINMELEGLFNYKISEQSLAQVQDVSAQIKGFLPTLLKYGNILIQSAGARNLFLFEQVRDPESISREINRLAQQFRMEIE